MRRGAHAQEAMRGVVRRVACVVAIGLVGCEGAELRSLAGCELVVRGDDGVDACLVSEDGAAFEIESSSALVDGELALDGEAGPDDGVVDADLGTDVGSDEDTHPVPVGDGALWRCGALPCRVELRGRDAVLDEAASLRFVEPARASALAGSLVEDADPRRAVRARALLARIQGASDPEAAAAALRATSEESAALGLWTEAMRDAVAEANLLRSRLFRFAEARAALARVEALAAHDPAMAIELRYHRGLAARDVGDVRSALQLFGAGAREARSRHDVRRERETLGAYARLLGALGRDAEAASAWARLATLDGDDPCAAADRATNRGWEALLAAERGERTIEVARTQLERAVRLYEDECPEPARRANARLNAALVAFHEGRFADARRAMGEPSEGEDATVRAWRAILGARLATSVDEGLAALAPISDGSVDASPALAWRLAIERARLLETQDPEAAIAALRDAEARLDAELLGVPLEAGRAGFVGRRDESLRGLVRIALANGRDVVALDALRRGLAREARALAAGARFDGLAEDVRARFEEALGRHRAVRVEIAALAAESWSLADDARRAQAERIAALEGRAQEALDAAHAALGVEASSELPELAADEVTLALYDQGSAVIVVAGDAARADAATVLGTDEGLVELGLRAVAGVLEGARRVRVVTSSALAGIDVGALSWRDGATLHLTHEVVEALDLPQPAGSDRADGRDLTDRAEGGAREGRALVVVDPRGDLSATHDEADGVARALAAEGFLVETLSGDAATHAPVVQRLRAAEVFHYAGHHVTAPGLRSALPLAAEGTLDARDVLALGRVPARVILSGCGSAARTDDPRGAVSLAQAFVLAGARWAVGTSRTVEDAEAARFLARWRARGLDEAGFFAARRASLAEGDVGASAFRWVVP